MPAKIPVCIGDHAFESLNKARIYYRDILNSYEPGELLIDEDKNKISQLAVGSNISTCPENYTTKAKVIKGKYGRKCFNVQLTKNEYKVISIIRSIKKFSND